MLGGTAARDLSHLVALHHGLQSLAVVGVGRAHADDQGQPSRVRQDVHLGTRLTSVHGARTCEFAPFLARTWAESSMTRETSTRPASSRSCRTFSCSRAHTPARDQMRNRRWAVDLETPKQGGIARQEHPLTSTYTMAANSLSSGVFCVPPPCGRTRSGGISGLAISHSPSGTIQLQVPRPMTESTSHHHIGHGLSGEASASHIRAGCRPPVSSGGRGGRPGGGLRCPTPGGCCS
jgi:hypothetical protein